MKQTISFEINKVGEIDVLDIVTEGNTENKDFWNFFSDYNNIKSIAKCLTGKEYNGLFVDEPHFDSKFTSISLYEKGC